MTTKTLIIYSSVDGQTLKIVDKISESITGEKVIYDLDALPDVDLSEYDKVLIGASVRYGKLRPNLYQFVNTHKAQLDDISNAFFLVCLTARKPEKVDPKNNAYMLKFDALSQWQPKLKVVFAGALMYSRYNWWQTLIIQMIMKITGGSTDKSKDIELTNWADVDAFSKDFAEL